MPCNTAHIFIDRFRSQLKRPLVHIVEATIDDAMRASPEGCWIIATGATLASGIYTDEAKRRGYTLFDVDETVRDLATEAIRLSVGKTFKLKAAVIPSNAARPGVRWKSSNSLVASVKKGLITAKHAGTAWITARSKDDPEITARVKVVVR